MRQWTAVLGLILLAACAATAEEGVTMDNAGKITLRWWGQACFSVTDEKGVCVLVDPFPRDFGYASPTVEPRVCLVTHEHRDHNAVDNVRGQPTVLRGKGLHEAAGLRFLGIAASHDDEQGAKRGQNTIFAWEMAGLRLVHVGDLGALLTGEQVKEIGAVDVLMIPVGGYYTIDAKQAVSVIGQLKPRVVAPMHYRTAAVPKSPIGPVDDFLSALPEEWKVDKPEGLTVDLSVADLPAEGVRVVVLGYE